MTKTVLAIGAHPDDEVLGVGGTLAKHADDGDEVHALILTDGATRQYDDESIVEEKKRAARRCGERLGLEAVHFGDLPDMKLDALPHVEVNAVIEELVADVEPEVVYTHSPHEVNSDHCETYESTLVATRPQTSVSAVYAYETPSSTEWVGGSESRFTADRYVDIDGYLDAKIEAFYEYDTEVREYPHPRSEKALRAKAESRGLEAGFEAAEALTVVTERVTEL